ncbi:MAG TPA: hypothetical protein VH743_14050 [Beijerinckiaceae bacterium]|jgi:hypothetical protein
MRFAKGSFVAQAPRCEALAQGVAVRGVVGEQDLVGLILSSMSAAFRDDAEQLTRAAGQTPVY